MELQEELRDLQEQCESFSSLIKNVGRCLFSQIRHFT